MCRSLSARRGQELPRAQIPDARRDHCPRRRARPAPNPPRAGVNRLPLSDRHQSLPRRSVAGGCQRPSGPVPRKALCHASSTPPSNHPCRVHPFPFTRPRRRALARPLPRHRDQDRRADGGERYRLGPPHPQSRARPQHRSDALGHLRQPCYQRNPQQRHRAPEARFRTDRPLPRPPHRRNDPGRSPRRRGAGPPPLPPRRPNRMAGNRLAGR